MTNPMADELLRVHRELTRIATDLDEKIEQRSKKRLRIAMGDAMVDLDCEVGKIRDSLCVYGHGDPGERPGTTQPGFAARVH